MNKDAILKSDVLDIIFDKRNKQYGAYTLRKFYSHRLFKSLGLMLGGVVVLSAFTFLPKTEKVNTKVEVPIISRLVDITEEKKKEPEKPKEKIVEPVKAKPAQQNTTAKRFTNTIIITKLNADTINNIKPNDLIASINHQGPNIAVITPIPFVPGIDKPGVKVPEDVKVDITTPMEADVVEVMPSYPGGLPALRKFLERNLTNPRDMEPGEDISVKIKFVVGYNGKLQTFTTVQDGGEIFNKEVIRVLKKMPEWIPGKSKGENVSVYYTIPIRFVPGE